RPGSATLQFTFAPDSEHARSSNVTIADISIPFTQDGNATPPAANCTYVISPMQVEIPASGGFAAVTVTASAQTCQWVADVGISWGFTLEGPTLITGSATLQYSVGPNLGAARSAYVSIGGTSIPVTQYGAPAPPPHPTHCTYIVSPMQVEMPAAGGSASVTVTASDPTCPWV